MKAYREDMPFNDERRGVLTIVLVAATVLVLAALLYFGLRDADAPVTSEPLPVVRDSTTVVPPVVDTDASASVPQQTAQATANARADLTERQLSSPRSAVGAGAAPVTNRSGADSVVINGELLEDLEAEAEAERQ